MAEPDNSGDNRGFQGYADESVGPSAMVLEGGDRPFESPENIEVGGLGGERHGQRGVGRLAIKTRAGEHRAGHEMRDWFHPGSSIPCSAPMSYA